MSAELHELGIAAVASLLQRGRISSVELTEAMIRRVERLDPDLHAFALTTFERAMDDARAADALIARRRWLGPLHGVPVALKDLCHTRGIRTMAGMPLHAGHVPDADGTVPARLRDAGSVLLGKLQLTEGAFTEHHPDIPAPVNPWGADTWSGASSTGSGVALAAGLCFGAIGSDTGGSIRFPCAACGVTGLKPTWGRVSVHGAFELAASLDHLGPMARSAEDCAILLQAMAGADERDPVCSRVAVPDYLAGDGAQLRGFRIGYDESFATDGVDGTMRTAVDDASRALRACEASIVPLRLPDAGGTIEDWGPNCAIEARVAHAATFPSMRERYGPTLAAFLDSAEGIDAATYQRILLRRRAYAGHLEASLREVDALLLPAQGVASPTLARMAALGEDPAALAGLIRFTAPIDMSGHPALTLPAGFGGRGTPVAVQLVGRWWGEAALLRAGRAFQRATDWHVRHPGTAPVER